MPTIDEQMTSERKNLLLYHMLTILGKRVELDYNDTQSVEFDSRGDSVDRYVLLQGDEVRLWMRSYYIHPHNGDDHTTNRYAGPVPRECVEAVYNKVRAAVIEHLGQERDAEARRKSDLQTMRNLIGKYGIPEDIH